MRSFPFRSKKAEMVEFWSQPLTLYEADILKAGFRGFQNPQII